MVRTIKLLFSDQEARIARFYYGNSKRINIKFNLLKKVLFVLSEKTKKN